LLARLRRDWTAEQDGVDADLTDDPAFDDTFAEWLSGAAGERHFWLAMDGCRAVGMVNVAVFTRMPRPGRPLACWGYVSNVYVTATHRNRGLGRQLLDACLEHARSEGYVRLVLSPSPRSYSFYERAGFARADGLMVLPL
jgi:GNAT superfamily N-acetyltransferase